MKTCGIITQKLPFNSDVMDLSDVLYQQLTRAYDDGFRRFKLCLNNRNDYLISQALKKLSAKAKHIRISIECDITTDDERNELFLNECDGLLIVFDVFSNSDIINAAYKKDIKVYTINLFDDCYSEKLPMMYTTILYIKSPLLYSKGLLLYFCISAVPGIPWKLPLFKTAFLMAQAITCEASVPETFTSASIFPTERA